MQEPFLKHFTASQRERGSLADVVLITIARLQRLVTESTMATRGAVLQIAFSIPYASETGPLPVLSPEDSVFSLAQARAYLQAIDQEVVFEHANLNTLPKTHIHRLNIKIQLE